MKTKHIIFVALFAALIAISAQIRIQLGPIPTTLQLPIILLAGLILGSRLGALSASVYLLIGLIGVPVFTSGGGLGSFLSPSFGFIIGFIPAAYIAGIGFKDTHAFSARLFYVYTAIIVAFMIGVAYFIFVMNIVLNSPIGFTDALMLTVTPFIVKDLIMGTLTVMFARVLMTRGVLRVVQ